MAPAGLAGFGAAGQDDDHGGDLRVAAADGQPGLLEDLDQQAGRAAVGAGFGEFGAGDRGPGPVVGFAEFGVGQGVVGLGDVPEPGGGLGVAGVGVGVVQAGQFAVGLLDLRRGGVGFDAEQRVVVGGPGFTAATGRGRRSRRG